MNKIVFRAETTEGVAPAPGELLPTMHLSAVDSQSSAARLPREHRAHECSADFPCQRTGCFGHVRFEGLRNPDIDGIARARGVPCSECNATYSLEWRPADAPRD
jgi:hypothetical protein